MIRWRQFSPALFQGTARLESLNMQHPAVLIFWSHMNSQVTTLGRSQSAAMSTNKVVRNTNAAVDDAGFAALTAGLTMSLNLPHPASSLLWSATLPAVPDHQVPQQQRGIGFVFALTVHGLHIGDPQHLSVATNGTQTVMMAMAGTAAIFLGLSLM